jgi:hypothetical protein
MGCSSAHSVTVSGVAPSLSTIIASKGLQIARNLDPHLF